MADPLNWKTRLEVTVDGKVVSAIDSFTPTFTTQTTPIHSIEADNIGAIFHPQIDRQYGRGKAITTFDNLLWQTARTRAFYSHWISQGCWGLCPCWRSRALY